MITDSKGQLTSAVKTRPQYSRSYVVYSCLFPCGAKTPIACIITNPKTVNPYSLPSKFTILICTQSALKTTVVDNMHPIVLSIQNIYIASLVWTEDEILLESADVSGQLPHKQLRNDYLDLFRNHYVAVKDVDDIHGYPLDVGMYFKLSRVEFLVVQVCDVQGFRATKSMQIYGTTYVHESDTIGKHQTCKFCFEQAQYANELLSPCLCKGSCSFVHVLCLQNWLRHKIKTEYNSLATSYNFAKFKCEICKQTLPQTIIINNRQLKMVDFQIPTSSYIILQKVVSNKSQFYNPQSNTQQRQLWIISASKDNQIKLGRDIDCAINITDNSISREHASINYHNGKFFLKDLQSKFGTLVKFRDQFIISKRIRIQYGRTCFEFKCVPNQSKGEIVEKDLSIQGFEQMKEDMI